MPSVAAAAGTDVVGAGVLRRLGGGALPSAAAAHWRSFSVSAATGFDNQNREMVLPLSLGSRYLASDLLHVVLVPLTLSRVKTCTCLLKECR
jgi:hypothetical protein